MNNADLIDRLSRLGSTESAGKDRGVSARVGAASPYLYFTSAAWVINVGFLFTPGQNGVWLVQAAIKFNGGTMRFESNVSWDDKGTPRSGWIYTCTPSDGSDSLVMFFGNDSDGQYYTGCATTLPYTPGQPPSGLDQPVAFYRLPS